MKSRSIGNKKESENALKHAFEKGYLLGLEDAKEGVFIDATCVSEHFYRNLDLDNNKHLDKG